MVITSVYADTSAMYNVKSIKYLVKSEGKWIF